MSKETEGKSVFDEEMLNRQLEAIKSLYNTAIDDAIKVVEDDLDESLNWSLSSTFASGHLKALIPKLQKLKK